MKKMFLLAVAGCLLAGLLANIGSLLMLFGDSAREAILYSGFGGALMKMGNRVQNSLFPGLAAGVVILIMGRQLYLWQGCMLCLVLPFCDVVFRNILLPILEVVIVSETISININAVFSNYIVFQQFVFPVFFIALSVYGAIIKNKIIVYLCLFWSFGWYVLVSLIPPFFPQFNLEQMRMDMGETTSWIMHYTWTYLAIILLAFFICYDIKERKKETRMNMMK